MKKKLLGVFLLLLALSILFICPASAAVDASRTFNLHRLKNGIGDSGNYTRYYWVASSASGELSRISSAMYNWNNTQVSGVQTPIWFKQTTNQSSSVMDIHLKTNLDRTIVGYTYFYRTSGTSQEVDPDEENWLWGKIELYLGNPNVCTYRDLNSFDRQGSIAHEMGHAFGLAHVTAESSIMNQLEYLRYNPQYARYDSYRRTVNQPQRNDYLTINLIYGPYNP